MTPEIEFLCMELYKKNIYPEFHESINSKLFPSFFLSLTFVGKFLDYFLPISVFFLNVRVCIIIKFIESHVEMGDMSV